MQCGAGPWISMESGDPAPLARPYLVPTRDWGVVVDTGSVAETNLADSRLSLKLRESVKAEPSRQRLSERHREPKRYSGLPPTGMFMASDGNRHRTGRTEMAPRAGQRKQHMTTWRYQLFVISVGAQASADVSGHQGLQDELNDLGRQGWELTAVTDAGDAKIFILKQPTNDWSDDATSEPAGD